MEMFLITLFFGFLGVHKFIRKQVGLGILYLFTVGLFGIGWFIDILIAFRNIPTSKSPINLSISGDIPNIIKNKIIIPNKVDKPSMLKLQQLVLPGHNKLIMSAEDLEKHSIQITNRKLEIVDDCIRLINNTDNVETFFSRYTVLLETLKELIPFEPYLNFYGYTPTEQFDYYISRKQSLIKSLGDRIYNKALIKADSLKTDSGKKNQFKKAYEIIMLYADEMMKETTNYIKGKFSNKIDIVDEDTISIHPISGDGKNNNLFFNYDDEENQ